MNSRVIKINKPLSLLFLVQMANVQRQQLLGISKKMAASKPSVSTQSGPSSIV